MISVDVKPHVSFSLRRQQIWRWRKRSNVFGVREVWRGMVTRFLSRSVRVKQHQQTEQCTCGSRRSSTVAYLDISVLFTLYSQPLSDVISAHGCDFHKYADDTELSQSAPPWWIFFCADRHSDKYWWRLILDEQQQAPVKQCQNRSNGCWHFISPQRGRLRFGKHRE